MGLIKNALYEAKLRRGAKAGDPASQRRLGHIYYGSKPPLQDFEKAVELYLLAAEQGDAIAQRQLGNCYFNGEGVQKNDQEAAKWYALAAKQGDTQAALDYAALCAVQEDEEPAEYTPQVRDFFKGAFDNASRENHRRVHAEIIKKNRDKS